MARLSKSAQRRRSKAARKGWETRRTARENRSRAAKKGWQTRRRREQARAEQRSEAARKGWLTREPEKAYARQAAVIHEIRYEAADYARHLYLGGLTGETVGGWTQIKAHIKERSSSFVAYIEFMDDLGFDYDEAVDLIFTPEGD